MTSGRRESARRRKADDVAGIHRTEVLTTFVHWHDALSII